MKGKSVIRRTSLPTYLMRKKSIEAITRVIEHLVPLKRIDKKRSSSRLCDSIKETVSFPNTTLKQKVKACSLLDFQSSLLRVYYNNERCCMKSTVLKIQNYTCTLELLRLLMKKYRLIEKEINEYCVLVIYPSTKSSSMTARTLKDHEKILQVQQDLKSQKENNFVRFILKDTRSAPLHIEEHSIPLHQKDNFILHSPFLNISSSGYLQKASRKDSNVWRKRWFVISDERLYYCNSHVDFSKIREIPLQKALIQLPSKDIRAPCTFELQTTKRVYQFNALNHQDKGQWITLLSKVILIRTENEWINPADTLIRDQMRIQSTQCDKKKRSFLSEILKDHKASTNFISFTQQDKTYDVLFAWMECERFQNAGSICRSQYHRDSRIIRRRSIRPNDLWNAAQIIIENTIPMVEGMISIKKESKQNVLDTLEYRERKIRLEKNSNLIESSEFELPPVNLFLDIQQQLEEYIKMEPLQRFIGLKKEYNHLLRQTMCGKSLAKSA